MRRMSHFEANDIDGPEFEDPESGVTDSSAEAEADEEVSPQQQGYIGGKGTGKGKGKGKSITHYIAPSLVFAPPQVQLPPHLVFAPRDVQLQALQRIVDEYEATTSS